MTFNNEIEKTKHEIEVMKRMNSVKITAEFIVTPEMFEKWCNSDFIPRGSDGFIRSERMYHQFVEGYIYEKFGDCEVVGSYDDWINTTIENNGNGLKLTIKEISKDFDEDEFNYQCYVEDYK